MQRKFYWVCLLALFAFTLSLGSTGFCQKDVTLRFLNCETDVNTVAYLNKIAAEWQQKTGVKVVVETVPEPESFTKIVASIKAGKPYDICNVMFIAHVVTLASEGHVLPVTSMIDKIGRSDFGPRILFPWKNEVWWMPYDYNFSLLFIRKDWFKEKNLNPPKTYDELMAAAKALTVDINGDGKIDRYGIALPLNRGGEMSFLSSPIFWGKGVRIFDDQWNFILDSPAMKPKVIDALKYYRDLYPYMPPGMISASWGDALAAFATEKAAMVPYAGRMVHHIEKFAPQLADKYQVIGFPSADGKTPATCFGYDGWFLLKGNNQKEAMAFLEWLSTEKLIGFLHTLSLHYQPTRYSIYKDPKWKEDALLKKHWPAMEAMLEVMNTGIINSIDTDGPTMDVRPAKIWEAMIIPEMIQDVIVKKMEPEKALEIAAAKARKLLGK
jgi:multiple sugar transport system substrate-binding protein